MTNKIVLLNHKEMEAVSGGISKQIVDLTDVAAAAGLGLLANMYIPAFVAVGGSGAALIGLGVILTSYWVIPTVSASLVKSPEEEK